MRFLPSKRRGLTLLEVLGALFLAGILLSTVLLYFRDYSHTQAKLCGLKQTVLDRSFVQLYLNKFFSKIENDLYLEQNSLIFTLNNGLDPNLHLSGPITGRLYLNEKKELTLKLEGHEGHSREIMVCDNISSLSFKFFDKDWKETWDKEEKIPSILQLYLNKDIQYSFFLPHASEVTYK